MGLLHIPPEIVLLIYQGLNTTTDAYNFAQSCRSAYIVFCDPYCRSKIFQSILVWFPNPERGPWMEHVDQHISM